jgi:hypothetical protein
MERPVCGTVGDNLENLEITLDLPEQAATATFDQALPDSDEASSWSYFALIRREDWLTTFSVDKLVEQNGISSCSNSCNLSNPLMCPQKQKH